MQPLHQPLHLKYRPQTLQELMGQSIIVRTLTNAIENQKIASTYLFTGPRGTGKTSTARIIAKSLNCLNSQEPTTNPCGECISCRAIEKGSSLDVIEIDAASNNGIDDIRELISRAALAPVQGRYRIFILDESHQLSTSAQNALLKCIEEPPEKTIFILATTEVHKLLPTIVSRCQVFNFKSISIKVLTQYLQQIADQENIEISTEALTLIARMTSGGLRDSLQLLSQLSLLGTPVTSDHVQELTGGCSPQKLLSLIKAIASRDTFAVLQHSRELLDAGKPPDLIFNSLLQGFRDLLIIKQVSLMQQDLELCEFTHKNDRTYRTNTTSSTQKELQQVWDTVINNSTKPGNKEFLKIAQLVKLSDRRATLAVQRKYLKKFQAKHNAIANLMKKALKLRATPTLTITSL